MESKQNVPAHPLSRSVLLAVADRFADVEYEAVRRALEDGGFQVRVASNVMSSLTGMGGSQIQPDLVFEDAQMDNFDGLFVIGGEGSIKFLWSNEFLRALILDTHQQGKKIVGAICAATPVLARAGILRQQSATVYPFAEGIHEIDTGGGNYRNEPVVVSGRIVTGRDPESSDAFAQAICRLLLEA